VFAFRRLKALCPQTARSDRVIGTIRAMDVARCLIFASLHSTQKTRLAVSHPCKLPLARLRWRFPTTGHTSLGEVFAGLSRARAEQGAYEESTPCDRRGSASTSRDTAGRTVTEGLTWVSITTRLPSVLRASR
jgi:hypothetical protein